MKMIDGLAPVVSSVDDGTVAFGQSLTARKLRCHPVQMANQGALLFGCLANRADVFTRNNQHMHWRLWVDVGKSVALVVLVDGLGGNASFDDPAKEAAHD